MRLTNRGAYRLVPLPFRIELFPAQCRGCLDQPAGKSFHGAPPCALAETGSCIPCFGGTVSSSPASFPAPRLDDRPVNEPAEMPCPKFPRWAMLPTLLGTAPYDPARSGLVVLRHLQRHKKKHLAFDMSRNASHPSSKLGMALGEVPNNRAICLCVLPGCWRI